MASFCPNILFDPTAPAISAQVPMLIGTVRNEFTTSLNHPELESMTEAEVTKRLGDMYGNQPEHIISGIPRRAPGREAL
jgi:para-nitrobenzyl esterase